MSNSICGTYCDFESDLGSKGEGFLNPTILANQTPEFDESYGQVSTILNNYYVAIFVKQDDVFFMPPKRNEVCNVKYVVPSYGGALYNVKFNYKGYDIYGQVWNTGDKEIQDNELWKYNKSYNFNHSVVQVINWKYQQKHIWENKGDHFEPQFQNEYFSVPKHYSNIKYYDIYVHSLALNTTLVESPQDVPTSVEENVKNMKKIVKTSYFNLVGIESNEAFDGLNIVKTQYSDGTLKVNKIYR